MTINDNFRIISVDQSKLTKHILYKFKEESLSDSPIAFAFIHRAFPNSPYTSLPPDSFYKVVSFYDLGVSFVYDSSRFDSYSNSRFVIDRIIQIAGCQALLIQLSKMGNVKTPNSIVFCAATNSSRYPTHLRGILRKVDQILTSFPKDSKYLAIVGGGVNLLDDAFIRSCDKAGSELECTLHVEQSLEYYGPLSRYVGEITLEHGI
jgi:hypothetical protein